MDAKKAVAEARKVTCTRANDDLQEGWRYVAGDEGCWPQRGSCEQPEG
jgi:hypothetical protein